MTNDQLVTSIDLSRRLNAVDCPYDTFFVWAIDEDATLTVQERWLVESGDDLTVVCAAYTSDELTALLPNEITIGDITGHLYTHQTMVYYQTPGADDHLLTALEERLPNSYARMYLALEEKGLV